MSFLTPLGLLLGGLVIPLTALYFVRLRQRRVKVSSLMLWHASSRSRQLASPFERFRRHWLFWLQLLCLLLLTLALGRISIQSASIPGSTLVIIVDSSASMGATDLSPSRFEVARQLALEAVSLLPSDGEVMILNAGPRPNVALGFTRDKSEAKERLNELSVSEAEGSLKAGLRLALHLTQSRPGVDLFILSDGSRENLEDLELRDVKLRFQAIGTRSDNVGITAISLRRSPTSSLEQQAFVTVENYSSTAQRGSVEIYFDDKLAGVRSETFPPSKAVSIVFELPHASRGKLRASVSAPNDFLAADNNAFAILEPVRSRKVLLVGGDKLTAHALKADPRVQLTTLASWPDNSRDRAGFDCVIFGANPPLKPPSIPHLLLGPYANSPLSYDDPVQLPIVNRWEKDHPVSRLIQWDAGTYASLSPTTGIPGMKALVSTDKGPLVLAGELNGTRVIQLSFDPLTSDLPLRISWPVFLFNSVGWLTESGSLDGETRQLRTGNPYSLPLPAGTTAKSVSVKDPNGNTLSPLIRNNRLSLTETTLSGIYTLEGPTFSKEIPLNLLSKRESNIAPQSSLNIRRTSQNQKTASTLPGHRELWQPILIAVLLLMLIEWLLFHRRRAV